MKLLAEWRRRIVISFHCLQAFKGTKILCKMLKKRNTDYALEIQAFILLLIRSYLSCVGEIWNTIENILRLCYLLEIKILH